MSRNFIGAMIGRYLDDRFGKKLDEIGYLSIMVSSQLKDMQRTVAGEVVTVLVLPPNKVGMASRTFEISKGVSYTQIFQPQITLPSGTWVVCVGRALITGVRVGYQAQEVFAGEGPACITVDECPVGTQLIVCVKA